MLESTKYLLFSFSYLGELRLALAGEAAGSYCRSPPHLELAILYEINAGVAAEWPKIYECEIVAIKP